VAPPGCPRQGGTHFEWIPDRFRRRYHASDDCAPVQLTAGPPLADPWVGPGGFSS